MEQKGGDRVKKDCLNCRHKKAKASAKPCRNCRIVESVPTEWQPEGGDYDENGLLPCPFCGGKAVLHTTIDGGDDAPAWVNCEECFCGTPFYDTKPDGRDNKKIVTDLWNRRAVE